ncbi:prepilin peptidase [Roseomonas sp. 18066]|uniref:prepilin peptidase n=1 Tax=Roseomonas sp. 18066 TaxID=2681412 RepID=UPI0013572F44|nr:prepilin peptidase [Roseomonas sp. 18066]
MDTAWLAAVLALLAALALVDASQRRLPHPLTALLAGLGLLAADDILLALVAGAMMAAPFWLLRRGASRGRVGGGDLRFGFALGCLLGPALASATAALALALLALCALLLRGAGQRVAALPLGPFLAPLAMAALVFCR